MPILMFWQLVWYRAGCFCDVRRLIMDSWACAVIAAVVILAALKLAGNWRSHG